MLSNSKIVHSVYLQNLPQTEENNNFIPKERDNFFDNLRNLGSKDEFSPNFSDILTSYSNINPSKEDNSIFIPTRPVNKFFGSFWEAYNRHGEIILSPDDIWIQICLGFSHHVNANSESLRKKFVDHEGQKELVVYYPQNENPLAIGFRWDLMFNGFEKELTKNTKEDIVKCMVSDFSTTGPIEKIVSQICLMDTLKRYFKYKFSTMCGISKLHFLGTLEDWENLLKKASNLKQYDASFWINQLEEILTEYINTYKGNVNLKFWNNIFNDYTRHGSGGFTSISGWILVFFPYGSNDQRILSDHYSRLKVDLKDIPNYATRTPFILELYDSTAYKMCLLAGFSDVICQDNKRFRPQLSAAIAWADEKAKNQNIKHIEKKIENNVGIFHVPGNLASYVSNERKSEMMQCKKCMRNLVFMTRIEEANNYCDGLYICDGCDHHLNLENGVWHCGCGYDICNLCSLGLKCLCDTCKIQLIYSTSIDNYQGELYVCDICKSNLEIKNGTHHCYQCGNFDVCIKCRSNRVLN